METELKFVLDADGAERLRTDLALPDTGRRLRSVYFDTPDLDLKSAGFVLRIREDDGKHIQCVKQTGDSSLISRQEWETPLDSADLDFTAIDATPLGAQLTPRRRDALAPAFEVDMHRAKREVEFEGARIEVALDEGEVRTVGRRTAIRELELELISGSPAALFALARTLRSSAPTLSFRTKSARGFALAADGPTCAAALAPPPLRGDMSAAEAFRAVAAACLSQIAANGEILRERRSVEAVHQLRVGARRLRSAIGLFRPIAPVASAVAVATELRWLARACDAARNLDVFVLETLAPIIETDADPEMLAAFAIALERRRAQAHEHVRQAVREDRFRALLLETAAWIEAGDWSSDPDLAEARGLPLDRFAAKALDRAYKRVRKRTKALKGEAPEPRHRLRIADKTLRYAISFFGPVFAGRDDKGVKAFKSAAEEAQDTLGAVTDIVSGRALCAEIAKAEADPGVTYAAGYVAGRLSAGEAVKLKAARKSVAKLQRRAPFW